MLKHVKNQLAAITYMATMVAVKAMPARSGQKHLLLVKTDEIGDYMLFRAYLKYIRTSEKYSGYKITLIGNIAWKDIFEALDKDTVDSVLWLNKKKANKDIRYRFSFFAQVRRLGATDVVNCIFSRTLLIDDGLVYVATGSNKTAMVSDNTNTSKIFGTWDRVIYNRVIDAGGQPTFDVIRNCNYVNELLGVKNIPTEIAVKWVPAEPAVTQPYFIMFLGAGNPERKWPASHFAAIAKYVQESYGLLPVICGGPPEEKEGEELRQQCGNEVLNYAGKTTLLQFIALLGKATFLLSVDTGAVHMAAAVGCPVIGLYSGKFYKRFAPYPTELAPLFYPVYPDFVDKLIEARDSVLYDTMIMKNDTIKMIPPDKVKKRIKLLMAEIINFDHKK